MATHPARLARVVLTVLAAVVGVDLVSSTIGGVTGNGSGASGPSSSYDSSAAGTEAMAQLLTENGHRVERLTTTLSDATVPDGGTVFVLDPTSWSGADTRALEGALAHGDRVVLGGRSPAAGVLRSLLGTTAPPVWRAAAAGTTHPVARLPEVASVGTVLSTGSGTFAPSTSDARGPVPLLRGPAGILAVVAEGRGTVILLASSSPLRNGSLGRADNAGLALDLVPPGAPALFDEYDHGFGRPGTGLAGLPASWRWGLGFLVLAVFVWVLSASRRFGPPDGPGRITVPPRVQYVDAMATLLSTRPMHQVVEAVEPVRQEARKRLCRRLGLSIDTPDQILAERLSRDVDRTALSAGLAATVLRPLASDGDVMVVGRALADLAAEGSINRDPPMTEPPTTPPPALPGSLAQLRLAVNQEVAKVVVGQTSLVDATLAAIAIGGHLLLRGPPGVAKTLLASAVARATGLDARRCNSHPTCSPPT